MSKAVVLLSAGLDSTVNLYRARKEFDEMLAITFNYGQRSASKEIERAIEMTRALGVSHEVIELPWLKRITRTSLVNKDMNVPTGDEVSINDYTQSVKTAQAVWVPNRNGAFLNIASSFADSMGAQWIIPGFNKEEAETFPDNSVEYIQAANRALSFSTQGPVQIKCYTQSLTKTEIVSLGRELRVNFDLIWSCYFDGEKMCGQCESCQRFYRAIKGAK